MIIFMFSALVLEFVVDLIWCRKYYKLLSAYKELENRVSSKNT